MADYEIGRGKPPREFSFKKGTSGNPRGRPKGRRRNLLSTIEATLNEKVEIEENGEKRTLTKREVTARCLIEHAMKGNVPALRLLAALMPAEHSTTPVTADDLGEQDRKLLESLSRRFTHAPAN